MSEQPSPAAEPAADPLEAGRAAFLAHDWPIAYERFAAADQAGGLSPQDLESFATAAFFTARGDQERELRERAFRAHLEAGDETRAAYHAIQLARDYGYSGRQSIASAWLRRAERILSAGGDTYAHGYLALVRSEVAVAAGEIDRALELAERAVEAGERFGERDLQAYGLATLGELRIATGATADGIALLEEASISAVNGELSPFTSGVTSCRMIAACRDLRDYRRASEWIEATERYCQRQSVTGFPGVCRVHRAEVDVVGGRWEQAEQDLIRVTTELEAYNATQVQGDGYYAIGELRLLKGDLAGAEAALREAHSRGRDPQPALALVRLAAGDARAAAASINAAVADQVWNRWARARLLPAQAEIAIAVGDLTSARKAVEELETIADYPSPALQATRAGVRGRLGLAEGDAAGAARELREAIRGWRDVGAPYEIARARAALSRALRALDDAADADLELQAANEEFRRLGAGPDAEATEREMRAVEARRGTPSHVHRTFMFTDIVGSTTLAEALGDEAWERLLSWHDQMLRGLVAEGGGEVVNSTGDGFFVAFETAGAAVGSAIAIQRALRDHRDRTGFALSVRIGIHSAEANERGGDYSGMGVHLASRVAGLADGGEIVATADTLREAGDVPADASREVAVKGASAPIRIASVAWR